MPAVDQCHEQVKRALQKDGWHITADPFPLFLTYRAAYIDLEATKGVNGTQEQIILVEVKCFAEGQAPTTQLYTAIGQYIVYRAMLAEEDINTSLFLSVPEATFDMVFDDVIKRVVGENAIRIVIVDLESEQIVRWIT